MKKFAIVTLPLLLAACVSDDYVTNVTSDSYQEEYKTAKVEAPVVSQSEQTGVVEENVVNVKSQGVGNDLQDEIIVSLTTFDRRINDVYLTIESLMQQSLRADKIVLCIADDNFNKDNIPATLKAQVDRGLEILFCQEDLGPYTKYFYTLQKYPDSLIITVDDDILYPVDMIDQLYRAYSAAPNIIHCHRAHKIRIGSDGLPLNYKEWQRDTADSMASLSIFPTGVGGVLYFPGCFNQDVVNKEKFMSLSPSADDIWLKVMSLKQGVLCQKIPDSRGFDSRFLTIPSSQNVSLKRRNKKKGFGNSEKIRAAFKAYGLSL